MGVQRSKTFSCRHRCTGGDTTLRPVNNCSLGITIYLAYFLSILVFELCWNVHCGRNNIEIHNWLFMTKNYLEKLTSSQAQWRSETMARRCVLRFLRLFCLFVCVLPWMWKTYFKLPRLNNRGLNCHPLRPTFNNITIYYSKHLLKTSESNQQK